VQVRAAMDRKFKPDFSKVFDHFLLHTGGRGVIDELEASLQLNAKQAEPSKDTLWRFGNTSAASTWYILGRIESTTGLRKGELVWQLGWVST
jgi:3-ketoacyl-CoA synthase